MSYVETLNRLMKDSQTSNVALGKAIGVSDVAVMRWRKGESVPSLENAISIAKYFDVSLDDLAGDNRNLDSNKYFRLPVIGKVSKFGVYANRLWADSYIQITAADLSGYPREECYALEVQDDTLLPDCFPNLSYLIFHQQSQCGDEDKVIVRGEDPNEIMFKIFRWEKDRIDLVCTNPNYRTITYRKQDINKLHIEAVMVGQYDAV